MRPFLPFAAAGAALVAGCALLLPTNKFTLNRPDAVTVVISADSDPQEVRVGVSVGCGLGEEFIIRVRAGNLPTGVSSSSRGVEVRCSSGATLGVTIGLSVGAVATAGVYRVAIIADAGTDVQTDTLTLTLTDGDPIVVSPSTISVAAGASAVATVTYPSDFSRVGVVGIEVTGAPPSVFATATIGQLEGQGAIALNVGASTPPGTYVLTVAVRSRTGRTLRAPLSLRVTAVAAGACAAAGGTVHPDLIQASETWSVAAGPHRVNGTTRVANNAVLTIQPGVLVCLGPDAVLSVFGGARLLAEGVPTDPIRFVPTDPAARWNGIQLGGAPGGASALRYVLVDRSDMGVAAADQHVVIIEDTRIRQTGVRALTLFPPGSRFVRSTIDTTLSTQQPAVLLGGGFGTVPIAFEGTVRAAAGEGVRIQSGSQPIAFRACEILGSGSHGLAVGGVASGGVTVSGCNLVNNGGLGVSNTAAFTLDARANWWGDPAGPAGPAGDGVSGFVDASGFLTAPAPIGPRPQF